jgi:electron transfer flavoprotein beta subunit
MIILVAVKRAVDYKVRVRPKADGSDVELANLKMAMNPFDEIAVEEALRIREAGQASEVVVVSMGAMACQETIRTALAMGADRGIHVATDGELQPLAVAGLLGAIAGRLRPGLVILGKQAIDDDSNQTGQMLAGMLGWGQGTFACEVRLGGGAVTVRREIDGGTQTVRLKLPAVITTDLRLNEPRYAKLPEIMKARKKPIEVLTPADLGVDAAPRLRLLKVGEPAARGKGVMVADAAELVARLRDEARVI